MSQTKVKSGLLNFPDQTDFVKLPSGTTAQRPVSPEEGYTRFNTTTDKLEFFDGVRWVTAGETPPTLTSVDYPGNALAADVAGGETILINGTNFASGISVTIGTTEVSVVTLNSTTQLAITSPALSAGDYDVKVTNLDGSTITALDFISYNGVPSWVTASGSLGSLNFGEAISTITLSATEPDSGVVTYAVTSGALPVGLTLSSSGEITGTMPSGSSETTYSFTVTATDDENQSTDRAFTVTGVVPFVPSEHFNTVLYTGNETSQNITGVGFDPDFVWMKNRDISSSHLIFDVQRSNNYLVPNSTQEEGSSASNDVNLITDGFSLSGGGTGSNNGGNRFVAWNFKAGGAAVENTDGTITSQVSANTEAGFSIVSYTGNGLTNQTIGHGLGKTPDMIITKGRANLSTYDNWDVWHKDLTLNYILALQSTGAEGFAGVDQRFVTSLNSDTVFGLGPDIYGPNSNGTTKIAYCFAEVEGFSNFGSYVGTGAAGNTVVTGFEPAFIMIKRTQGAGNWLMFDNKRSTSNPLELNLDANNSEAEENNINYRPSFLENGFSIAGTSGGINASGETYIYMAFAADPNTQVPTKADSFNTVLYTGDNTTSRNITGVGFNPDLTWIKNRSSSGENHAIGDTVRGGGKILYPNLTNAENGFEYITPSGVSDGFLITTNNNNASNNNYVAWNWKAGETPSINTDGSITSVVSANPAAGFSIVSWTGSGANATIGHGLNDAPKMLIVKNRADAENWVVWHNELSGGGDALIELNLFNAASTFANIWNSTIPNDSVFYVGSNNATNGLNDGQIAYCFAEVAGFSKFGSYTGTGSAGNAQDCGFEPAFVMLKSSSNAGNWRMWDNKRSTSDPRNRVIIANDINSEFYPDVSINFTSTGFSFNASGSNDSGQTFIYMAFANQF